MKWRTTWRLSCCHVYYQYAVFVMSTYYHGPYGTCMHNIYDIDRYVCLVGIVMAVQLTAEMNGGNRSQNLDVEFQLSLHWCLMSVMVSQFNCLFNSLFRLVTMKTPKLRINSLLYRESPVTDGFPSKRVYGGYWFNVMKSSKCLVNFVVLYASMCNSTWRNTNSRYCGPLS